MVASRGLRRWKLSATTDPRCPSRIRRSLLLGTSQSRTVLSRLPTASICPLGSNPTLQTGLRCLSNRRGNAPLVVPHKITVPSVLPLARSRPPEPRPPPTTPPRHPPHVLVN